MKNKTIIILIFTTILFVTYCIYNYTVTNYQYNNKLQKDIKSFENINTRIDKHISDSSNYIYYNLDYIKNEFIKVDNFFEEFSKEDLVLQNQDISKKLKELKSIFEKKDFINYKFQKINVILKNSAIYLSTLLSKSQSLFDDDKYLSLIGKSISNVCLAKSSNDKDFLINLNKDMSVLKNYKFNSKNKQEFNTMLIAHLNIYNTKYKRYTLYVNQLGDDIYNTKIENFKDIIDKSINKKLSLVTIYLWIYLFVFLLATIVILYLVKRIQQQEINIITQSKNAQLGEMIGNIAHQWRQPLSVVSTASTGMKMQKEFGVLTDEQFYINCDAINENAQYLSKTIETFRNYIKEKKEMKTVVLQDRINLALDITNATFKNNNIKLINNINNTNPIKITMIVGELSEVIINICNNAKDILLEKKIIDAWIKIDLKQSNDEAIITIEDNGGGIPKDILPKIFNPYFTTKHKSQGTGLGLYMSHQMIVKSLKGEINAENTKNGAIFTIKLPLDI